jgi:hypothetical protein
VSAVVLNTFVPIGGRFGDSWGVCHLLRMCSPQISVNFVGMLGFWYENVALLRGYS